MDQNIHSYNKHKELIILKDYAALKCLKLVEAVLNVDDFKHINSHCSKGYP